MGVVGENDGAALGFGRFTERTFLFVLFGGIMVVHEIVETFFCDRNAAIGFCLTFLGFRDIRSQIFLV